MKEKTKARLIAYYLPQFHPVLVNDEHWGKGFTEWTNVAKAKPLFKGHYQPFLPTELGYYDLRNPEVREQQANLAIEYGIEGFCYWHYWFGNGKRILERPFNEVLKSGSPDFPFCLCWANHSWTAVWVGDTKKVILEQNYSGIKDYTMHFYELLPAFKDNRYIKVNDMLLFSIFAPKSIPSCVDFVRTWRSLAAKEGLAGFYFVGMGVSSVEMRLLGLDGITPHTPHPLLYKIPIKLKDKISYKLFKKNYIEFKAKLLKKPRIYEYKDIVELTRLQNYGDDEYPVAIPNWDHTPRGGRKSFLFHNSTPQLFGHMLEYCIKAVINRPAQNRIVFLKAWNEWAEGNFIEPEAKFGRGYLEVIKEVNKIS